MQKAQREGRLTGVRALWRGARCALLICSVLVVATASAGTARQDIRQLFEQYIAAWNDGDFDRMASAIYRPPVYIFDREATSAFTSADQLAAFLRALRVDLDAAGFSHSQLRHVGVCELGSNLAFATLHFNRLDRSGATMGEEILASSYIVRKTPAGWGLVAHIVQAVPTAVECPPK